MNIEQYFYQQYMKPGDIVYDIGSHVGEMSIIFSNQGASKVYSFEPVEFNFRNLVNNTQNFPNIIPINCALHEKEYVCSTKFKHCNLNYPLDRGEGGSDISISYRILENLIKEMNLPLPNFIKIDIEGMESIVLKTFDFLFTTVRPTIFVELHVAPINEPQRYEDNPHWETPENGGFDFNLLKKYQYDIIDKSLQKYNIDRNWNPQPVTHDSIILIPK